MIFNEKIRISYSAITDFTSCRRLYYFRNIYKNPETKRRIQIANPYLSLGSAVHEIIEDLMCLPPSKRVTKKLNKKFTHSWKNYSGKIGGFASKEQERELFERGKKMLLKIEGSSFLRKKTIRTSEKLLKTKLTEKSDLVGAFDWIEILPNKSLHIIDFKTGKNKEKKDSLQLPIYQILAQENYQKKVAKLSYWYLERESKPTPQKKSGIKTYIEKIKEKSEKIEKAIEDRNFSCSSGKKRCFWCYQYESIFSGQAEYLGTNKNKDRDIYYLTTPSDVFRKIKEEMNLSKKEKEIIEMRLSNCNMQKIINKTKSNSQEIRNDIKSIKSKIKQALSPRELRVFVKELQKNGKKLEL